MRKILLTLLFVAAAFSLYGQTGLGTAGQQEYARALTNGGRFGAPRYTTANRPTCSASNLGGTIWNTTTGTEQTCDGSTWNSMASASGGSIGPLTSITVGTTTTAGTATCVIDDTMGGASATDNFLNCTGTMPTTLTATGQAVLISMTSAGSSSQTNAALRVVYNQGYTGANETAAIYGQTGAESTGTVVTSVPGAALFGKNTGGGSSERIGTLGWAASPTSGLSVGTVGMVTQGTTRVGVWGVGSTTGWSGFFGPTVPIASVDAALGASNGALAIDIFRLYDNTTVQYVMADGGTGTFTSAQAFSGGLSILAGQDLVLGTAATIGSLSPRTTLTPDGWFLTTGTLAESIHVGQAGDVAFDFNNGRCLTAACTNPSLILHSPDQVTTEYLQLQTDATGAAHVQSNLAEITVGGSKLNITEASAQAIVRITMPSSAVFGATVTYLVSDGDGTDFVGRSGSIIIQGANKAGTSVCTILATRDQETEDGSQIVNAAGAFTLTYTWTNVVNTTSCDLSLNGASSAGVGTYDITYTVILMGTSNAITVNPQ